MIRFCKYQTQDEKLLCYSHAYPLFRPEDFFKCPYKTEDVTYEHKIEKCPDFELCELEEILTWCEDYGKYFGTEEDKEKDCGNDYLTCSFLKKKGKVFSCNMECKHERN